jgi:hypothetical protein
MAQALDDREDETGRGDLKGDALADESGELGCMLKDVDRCGDAAGAVAKQEQGRPASLDFAICTVPVTSLAYSTTSST